MSARILLPGLAGILLSGTSVLAADLPTKTAPPVFVQEHCKTGVTTPAFGPTIKANPDPSCWASPIGDIYFGGALSGYYYHTTNHFADFAIPGTDPDRANRLDFTNVLGWVQTVDGPFQFFALAGLYSIPSLGLPVYKSVDQNDLLFGPVPAAYGKYVINDNWSIQAGRMFTNIGSELPFTFQNINISRGLLFNQENIINQGVQVNYSNGPVNAAVAVTDGFYSGELSWVTGYLTYALDDHNTVGVNGGVSFTDVNTANRGIKYNFATPLAYQNSNIISVNYTYTNGPLTITPYAQYTVVDADARLGLLKGETYGGAILAAYSFNDWFSLGGRLEYIAQNGNKNLFNATSLLYGPGSSAFSATITPTFTFGRYFLRAEYSHVELYDVTPGFGFGRNGTKKDQDRYMVETGITF